MHRVVGESDANEFMAMIVGELAARRPALRDQSGRGFWPTPALFPLLLAHCLRLLQQRVSDLYLAGKQDHGELLATCRCNLLKLVSEGDLGEDHTSLFLADHPGLVALPRDETQRLPFSGFCQQVLSIEDPIILLGVLMRNEAGSLGEMESLLKEDLIAPGRFSEVHLVEEVEHAFLAEGIAERLAVEPELSRCFEAGQRLHDEIYVGLAHGWGSV